MPYKTEKMRLSPAGSYKVKAPQINEGQYRSQ